MMIKIITVSVLAFHTNCCHADDKYPYEQRNAYIFNEIYNTWF